MKFDDTAYLEHHGVLGMKWGVRRYQNADGSLTSAGKKHRKSLGDSTPVKALKKAKNGVSDIIQNSKNKKAAKEQAKANAAAEKARQERDTAVMLGDAKTILKYRSTFSDSELKEALTRARDISAMSKLVPPSKLQKALTTAGKVYNVSKTGLKDITGAISTVHRGATTAVRDVKAIGSTLGGVATKVSEIAGPRIRAALAAAGEDLRDTVETYGTEGDKKLLRSITSDMPTSPDDWLSKITRGRKARGGNKRTSRGNTSYSYKDLDEPYDSDGNLKPGGFRF